MPYAAELFVGGLEPGLYMLVTGPGGTGIRFMRSRR
jgi:hypothetical protein